MAEHAQQEVVAPERRPALQANDQTDFTPPKDNSWSGIASQCWNGDYKGCLSSAGQKFGDMLGWTSPREQDLVKQGTIPDVKVVQPETDIRVATTAETGTEGADLPKAMQGENRRRTETLMDPKTNPQERLKAASELVAAGIKTFTIQGADGTINKVRLEKEGIGSGRSMLGVYVSARSGAELNALRAIQNADGSIVQQKDGNRPVDYKNRGASLLDRLATSGKVVADDTAGGSKPDKSEARTPDTERRVKPEPRRTEDKTEPGQWKSPLERKYNEGDRFKGITSVYWEDSQTASGVRFNKNELTAASREFPFGTVLKVRNPENGRETRLVITDNGPFAGRKEARPDGSERIHNRVLDISSGVARAIGMTDTTPRAMEISVESIPEGRAWGHARRNLSRQDKEALLAQVRKVTAEART